MNLGMIKLIIVVSLSRSLALSLSLSFSLLSLSLSLYIYIYIYINIIYKGLRILSRYCSCQDSEFRSAMETSSVDIDKLLSKNFFL